MISDFCLLTCTNTVEWILDFLLHSFCCTGWSEQLAIDCAHCITVKEDIPVIGPPDGLLGCAALCQDDLWLGVDGGIKLID